MKKIIFSFICALTIFTACEKIVFKDLSSDPIVTSPLPDTTPPTVTIADPVANATGVSLNKRVIVTFNEAMDPLSITALTFTLKQGSTAVTGTVSYTGTQASFVASGNFAPNSLYTGTITTGVRDLAGNAMSSNFTFSFTTGTVLDVTPPTVVSADPANNATGIATGKVIGITFSEAMTASTITTSTFTLKQGTTAVAGTVGYTGTTATFTPSAALTAGTVYTAAISTGAKDLAGNALTASATWSFTTAGTAPAPGLSFAADVIPVLNLCESCHNHGWTPSSNASTYYTNLVNRGYVKPTSYTSSTLYTKIQNGHPGPGSISKANTDKIINWMIQGSKNN